MSIIFTKIVSGMSSIAAASTALLNLSSPTAVWSLANQLQLLLSLILTGAYFPTQITDYLSGQTFASFNFDFIPVVEIPLIKIPIESLDFNHSYSNLNAIGVKSGSSFVNNLGLLFTIMVLVSIHLLSL